MSFLSLNEVGKTFPDGTAAVRGIDLSCTEGNMVVFLGPSGCGKTTTLRMVAGLEYVSHGRIELDRHDITERSPGDRDVGFVFQFYALYPHRCVFDNISFSLEAVATPRRELRQRVEEVIDQLGLGPLAGHYPAQLSGGDRQRVALARAMVRSPRLYLMDEPLGTLDSASRLELGQLIRSQQMARGVTTLYVTHDQEEALSLADVVVVMEGGRIRQIGSPSEVYDRPADLFVAHFIGSPGMNVISGEVVVVDGVCCFRAPGDWCCRLDCVIAPGRKLLGVRPEFVHPAGSGGLQGEVLWSEYLGASRIVHVQTRCGRVSMRVGDEERFEPGSSIGLVFESDHLRFFDTASERYCG